MSDPFRIRRAPDGYKPLVDFGQPEIPEDQPYMVRKAPDSYQPMVAFEPEENWLESAVRWTGDVGATVAKGAAATGQGIGFLVELTGDMILDGPNFISEAGAALKERAGWSADSWSRLVSKGFQAQADAQIIERDESSPLGYKLGDDWTITTLIAGAAASVPEMMLTAGTAKAASMLATAALKRGAPGLMAEAAAGGVRANKILKRAQIVAGAIGGGLTEGAMAGGASGVAIEEDILSRDHDALMIGSSRYRDIYNSTDGDENEEARHEYAKRSLAKEAANSVAFNVGIATAITGAPMGAFFGTLGRKAAASGIADTAVGKAATKAATTLGERTGFAGTVAKGAAGEAAQEFVQSGAEQVLQNLGIREYADFTQDPWEGVLNAAVTGGLVGGVLGAGTTAIFESGTAPGGIKPTTPDKRSKPGPGGTDPGQPPPKFAKPSEAMVQRTQKILDEVQAANVPASEFMKVSRWAGRNQLDGAPGDRTLIEFNRALEILRDTGKAPEFIQSKVGEDIDESGYLTQAAFVKDAGKLGFETSARFTPQPGQVDEVMGALANAGATGYVMGDGSIIVPVRKQGESALQMVAQQVQGATGVAYSIGAPEVTSNANATGGNPTEPANAQAADNGSGGGSTTAKATDDGSGSGSTTAKATDDGSGSGSAADAAVQAASETATGGNATAATGQAAGTQPAQVLSGRAGNVARQITESGLQPDAVTARSSGRVEVSPTASPDVAERAIEIAANDAATSPQNDFREPSDPEIKSGNYRKGKVKLAGLNISIENPAGSIRKSRSGTKRPWRRKMKNHYGYISGTKSQDGEPLDVYVGRGANDPNKQVFIVQQLDPKTAEFDEHKIMLGFDSEGEAKNAYLSHFPTGWKGFGSVISMTNEQAREWMKRGDTDVPINPFNKEPLTLQRKFTSIELPDGVDGQRIAEETDGEITNNVLKIPVAAEGRARRAIKKQQGERKPEQEELREEVEELKGELRTSPVTGLPNLRAFKEALRSGNRRGFFHRSGDEFAAIFDDGRVAALDMDGLKRINDTLSHDAADAILRELGAFLQTVQTTGRPAEAVMREVQAELDKFHVHLSYRGRRAVYEGIGVSYGIGESYEQADAKAAEQKLERLASGVREDARRDETRSPRRLRDLGPIEEGAENRTRRAGERDENRPGTVRSGAFGIAPDPNDRVRSEAFAALPQEEKDRLTHELNSLITPQIMGVLDIEGDGFHSSFGGYLDQVSPSLAVEFSDGTTREQALRAAAAAGYVYSQDSVIMLDKDAPEKVGAVTLAFEGEFNRETATAVYNHLRQNVGIEGFSDVDGKMLILDFSGPDASALAERINNSLALYEGEVTVTIAHGSIGATFIAKDQYEDAIRGTDGQSPEWEALGDLRREFADILSERLGVERPAFNIGPEPAGRAEADGLRDAGRVRGSARVSSRESGPYPKAARGEDLKGLPTGFRVDGELIHFHSFKKAQRVARGYMRDAGMPYNPPTTYARVNPERARKIARAYDSMKHDPQNPAVAAAYEALVAETSEQYRAILKYHPEFRVQFIDYAATGDPYGTNPRKVILDIVQNNHMWIFSTKSGFGSDAEFDPNENMLLRETEFRTADGEVMLANDVFRVVHDYFGHVMTGTGFRADGEENAWRSHVAMYTPEARMAVTAETRGQNSFVNFSDKIIRGNHPGAGMTVAEWNAGRSGGDTFYADQKMGVLPDWVMEDGASDEMPALSLVDNDKAKEEDEANVAVRADDMFEFGAVRFYSRLRRVIRTNGPKAATVDKWKKFFERMISEGRIGKEEAKFVDINSVLDGLVQEGEQIIQTPDLGAVTLDALMNMRAAIEKDIESGALGLSGDRELKDIDFVIEGVKPSVVDIAEVKELIAKEPGNTKHQDALDDLNKYVRRKIQTMKDKYTYTVGSGALNAELKKLFYIPESAYTLNKDEVLVATRTPKIETVMRGTDPVTGEESEDEDAYNERVDNAMSDSDLVDFENGYEWKSRIEESERKREYVVVNTKHVTLETSVGDMVELLKTLRPMYPSDLPAAFDDSAVDELAGTMSSVKDDFKSMKMIINEGAVSESDARDFVQIVNELSDAFERGYQDYANDNGLMPDDSDEAERYVNDYLDEAFSQEEVNAAIKAMKKARILKFNYDSVRDGTEYLVYDEDGDFVESFYVDDYWSAKRRLERARDKERETDAYLEALREHVIENMEGPSADERLEYGDYTSQGSDDTKQEWTFHWNTDRSHFNAPHFKTDNNTVMHARTSVRPIIGAPLSDTEKKEGQDETQTDLFPARAESQPVDAFFIEEIQSDWAQAVDRTRSEIIRMFVNYMGMNTAKASKLVPEEIGLSEMNEQRSQLMKQVEAHIEREKTEIMSSMMASVPKAVAGVGIPKEIAERAIYSRFASREIERKAMEAEQFTEEVLLRRVSIEDIANRIFKNGNLSSSDWPGISDMFGYSPEEVVIDAIAMEIANENPVVPMSDPSLYSLKAIELTTAFRKRVFEEVLSKRTDISTEELFALANKLKNFESTQRGYKYGTNLIPELQVMVDRLLESAPELSVITEKDEWLSSNQLSDGGMKELRARGYFAPDSTPEMDREKKLRQYAHITKAIAEGLAPTFARRRTYRELVDYYEYARGSISSFARPPLLSAWSDTTFKMFVAHAASKGFTHIAWTSGLQQGRRYSSALTRSYKSVSYIPYDASTMALRGHAPGKAIVAHVIQAIDNNGQKHDFSFDSKGISIRQIQTARYSLQGLFGKSFAEKVLSGQAKQDAMTEWSKNFRVTPNYIRDGETRESPIPEVNYTSEVLEASGGGMVQFYDRELVRTAEKFLKSIDPEAKVTQAEMPGQTDGLNNFNDRGGKAPVWVIPITQKMRDALGLGEMPAWSIAKPSGTPLTTIQVCEKVNAIRSKWKAAPQINIVKSAKELPPRFSRWLASIGPDKTPRGFYADGQVWMIADALSSPEDVEAVLFEEALGHFGLRAMLGREAFNALRDKITPSIKKTARYREIARRYASVVAGLTPTERDRVLADEYLAQVPPNDNPSVWRMIVAAVRDWLRRNGFIKEWSDNDIVDLMYRVHDGVRTGLVPTSFTRMRQSIVRFGESGNIETSYRGSAGEGSVSISYGERLVSIPSVGLSARVAPIAGQNGPVLAVNEMVGGSKEALAALARFAAEEGVRELVFSPAAASVKTLKRAGLKGESVGQGVLVKLPERLYRKSREDMPAFSLRNRAEGDPEVERILSKALEPTPHDLNLWGKMQHYFRMIRDRFSIGETMLELKTAWIDSAASIEALERGQYGGSLLDASQSAYKMVNLTRNLPQLVAAVSKFGVPQYNAGSFVTVPGRMGLYEIFRPLHQTADGKNQVYLWEGYALARRASQLIQQTNRDGTSKEKLLTQEEIDKLLELENKYPHFKTVFDNWQQFHSDMLDLAVDRGVMSREEADLWKQNDYVPFYRVMDADEESVGGGGVRRHGGFSNQQYKSKRLTGSERMIEPVMQNIVLNTAALIDRIYKNEAMQRIVALGESAGVLEAEPMKVEGIKFTNEDIARALSKSGLVVGDDQDPRARQFNRQFWWNDTGVDPTKGYDHAIRVVEKMTDQQKEQWTTLFRRLKPFGNDVVGVSRGGKLEYYRVKDPLVLRAIMDMKSMDFGGLVDAMQGAKNVLTKMVTLDPAFMVANWMRDTLSSFVTSSANFVPLSTAIQDARDIWNGDGLSRDLAVAGGVGETFYNPITDLRDVLGKVNPPDGSVLVNTPRKLWETYRKIGFVSEQINRFAIARKVLADGGSMAEAAYQAQDIMNFAQRGDSIAAQFLIRTVPFINARIQSLYRLYKGALGRDSDDPAAARRAFWTKSIMLCMASMLLSLKNWDDERYEKLPDDQKDTYWHIFVGNEHFVIPKPFEVGVIAATIPERVVRALMGQDSGRTLTDSMKRALLETFAFNPLPQAIKPIVEQFANKTFFSGQPIVNASIDGLIPEEQANPWTSETARVLARIMPDFMPDGFRSPVRIEAAARAYFGTIGSYILAGSDTIVSKLGGFPEEPTGRFPFLPDAPIARFVRGDPAIQSRNKYADDLYRAVGEADDIYRTLNMYLRTNRAEEAFKLAGERKTELQLRGLFAEFREGLGNLNTRQRFVMISEMTPDEKRQQIDQINRERNEMLEMARPYLKMVD